MRLNPHVALVTIGHGGWTLYHGKSDGYTRATVQGYGDDWRTYLDTPDGDVFIPAGTPVVDCTGHLCDLAGYATRCPMPSTDLGPEQVHPFMGKPTDWDGVRCSGMARVGVEVFLAHAATFGVKITAAGTGERLIPRLPAPRPKDLDADDAVSIGLAVDPGATFQVVGQRVLSTHA